MLTYSSGGQSHREPDQQARLGRASTGGRAIHHHLDADDQRPNHAATAARAQHQRGADRHDRRRDREHRHVRVDAIDGPAARHDGLRHPADLRRHRRLPVQHAVRHQQPQLLRRQQHLHQQHVGIRLCLRQRVRVRVRLRCLLRLLQLHHHSDFVLQRCQHLEFRYHHRLHQGQL